MDSRRRTTRTSEILKVRNEVIRGKMKVNSVERGTRYFEMVLTRFTQGITDGLSELAEENEVTRETGVERVTKRKNRNNWRLSKPTNMAKSEWEPITDTKLQTSCYRQTITAHSLIRALCGAINILNNFTDDIPSWKLIASLLVNCILQNLKIHFRVQRSSPVLVLSQISPLPSYFSTFHFNIIPLKIRSFKWYLSFRISHPKSYMRFFSPP